MPATTASTESAAQRTRASRCRKYFTTQRIIVISFALVEAVALAWAVGSVVLRDAAR